MKLADRIAKAIVRESHILTESEWSDLVQGIIDTHVHDRVEAIDNEVPQKSNKYISILNKKNLS